MLYLPYGNKDFGMYVLLPVKGGKPLLTSFKGSRLGNSSSS